MRTNKNGKSFLRKSLGLVGANAAFQGAYISINHALSKAKEKGGEGTSNSE